MRRWLTSLLLFSLWLAPVLHRPLPRSAGIIAAQAPRRVNVPYFSGDLDLNQAAIFWFGQYELSLPGRNYVDVRVAYLPEGLYLRATIIDYYLWYLADPHSDDDLTRYDALAIYLDTQADRAGAPQPDDYYFLVGEHGDGPGQNTPEYRRQALGTGQTWNPAFAGAWLDYGGWQWSSGGPNNNGENLDYGWVGGGMLPWSTLGLSGPPSAGSIWGFGLALYDRDADFPEAMLPLETWPENLDGNVPATWGELHFGSPVYTPPPAVRSGQTLIRATTPTDPVVEDSWMGGGGWCVGGHEGHGLENHGQAQELFVGSEIVPTHFPCYNKSILRFHLESLPQDRVILSATLTLHHWGNAGDPNATQEEDLPHDSFAWIFSLRPQDAWSENTVQWNNMPLAQENLDRQQIVSLYAFPGWPGVPYTWDVTAATAAAYASGTPLNLGLYDAAIGRNTSKYLTASQSGLGDGTPNWNLAGRPRLEVVWGQAVGTLVKRATSTIPAAGDPLTYTVNLTGVGQTVLLTDTLPPGLGAPIVLIASLGTPLYQSAARRITWSGNLAVGQSVALTYTVPVQASVGTTLTNVAVLSWSGGSTQASCVVQVGGNRIFVPRLKR